MAASFHRKNKVSENGAYRLPLEFMRHLTIYCEFPEAPRLRYTMEVFIGMLMGCTFELTTDRRAYLGAKGARLNYSRQRLDAGEIFLPAGALLRERGIAPGARPAQVSSYAGLPAFFFEEAPAAGDLPFDLFAMVFFLISRYEEYLPFTADAHGRFPAAAAVAHRHGFLERPLVEEWAQQFGQLLATRFPGWKPSPPAYHFQPTYDIDLAWAYRHRSPIRTFLALLRDLLREGPPVAGKRLAVLLGRREDPYEEVFRWLHELDKQWPCAPVFFFLLAGYGRFDRGIHYRRRALQSLVRDMAGRYRLGIHPSYRSLQNELLLAAEIHRLARLLKSPVSRSRQHYLRLRLPDTYQALQKHGIQADFTMGFADAIGFRASIATPYPWYDLKLERKAPLTIWPFQVMDVTLKNYLQLSPAEAVAAVLPLIDRTRQAGGTFTTLWHNSSLAEEGEWIGWRDVYRQIYTAAWTTEAPGQPPAKAE